MSSKEGLIKTIRHSEEVSKEAITQNWFVIIIFSICTFWLLYAGSISITIIYAIILLYFIVIMKILSGLMFEIEVYKDRIFLVSRPRMFLFFNINKVFYFKDSYFTAYYLSKDKKDIYPSVVVQNKKEEIIYSQTNTLINDAIVEAVKAGGYSILFVNWDDYFDSRTKEIYLKAKAHPNVAVFWDDNYQNIFTSGEINRSYMKAFNNWKKENFRNEYSKLHHMAYEHIGTIGDNILCSIRIEIGNSITGGYAADWITIDKTKKAYYLKYQNGLNEIENISKDKVNRLVDLLEIPEIWNEPSNISMIIPNASTYFISIYQKRQFNSDKIHQVVLSEPLIVGKFNLKLLPENYQNSKNIGALVEFVCSRLE